LNKSAAGDSQDPQRFRNKIQERLSIKIHSSIAIQTGNRRQSYLQTLLKRYHQRQRAVPGIKTASLRAFLFQSLS
jgi:hypothetical protein